MGEPRNQLKAILKARGRTPLGTWFMSASNVVAEAVGWAGFDFVVLDMEHSPVEVGGAFALMQAFAGTPTEVIVRVPWSDPVTVKRVLDAGARTLMFPMIQSAEEARAAVAATRYPPAGIRGVAAMHRGSRFGTVAGYLGGANDEVGVVVQLETPEAVAAREAIAGVEGVDAVLLGPGDLSAAMGRLGQASAPEVQALMRETAAFCAERGLACGTVGPDVATVERYIEAGFSFVAVGSDLSLMMQRAGEVIAAIAGPRETTADAERVY
jgi:4-hydroxy-2-oxoheptanedioate aldolase